MTEMTIPHKEKLMSDLRVVIADAEELLKLTASQVGDKAAELRMRMQARLEQARADLAALQAAAMVRAREAGQAADDYVQQNPWQAVGIAATAGFFVGLLLSRR